MNRLLGQEDTICAIATPSGIGSIGIVRVSGDQAFSIVQKIFSASGSKKKTPLSDCSSHTVHHGVIRNPATGQPVDEALLVIMKAGHSYTGEDVIEIQSHGNPHLLQTILTLLVSSGARLAEAGEFTRRAYLSGRIDLARAEAVMELIMARSQRAQEMALKQLQGGLSALLDTLREGLIALLSQIEASIDFSEQGIDLISPKEIETGIGRCQQEIRALVARYEEGRQIREGSTVVIFGPPNVGKSSVMNRLVGEERAIVTPIPGTTRDTLSEWISLQGHLIQIIDTAGFHETADPIEQEGMRRGEEALKRADLALFVLDATQPLGSDEIAAGDRIACKKRLLILNKGDLPQKIDIDAVRTHYPNDPIIICSAKTGEHFVELKAQLCNLLIPQEDASEGRPLVFLLRQKIALDRASEGLQGALRSTQEKAPVEFIAADIRVALDVLGEIVGDTTPDAILDQIFGQFCIGK